MALVYQHIRLDNNKIFYIGIGKYEGRAYTKKKRSPYWQNIVKKHGYKVEIIYDNLTWEEACKKEIFLIKSLGRIDLKTGNLVNLTDGGDGQYNPSLETRLKISNGNKGKKISKSLMEKLIKANKGRKVSEETKMKQKRTLFLNGGYSPSAETRQKIAKFNEKPIISWKSEDKSDIIFYKSIKEAQIINKISNISEVCNGNRKTSGGLFWSFIKNDNNKNKENEIKIWDKSLLESYS